MARRMLRSSVGIPWDRLELHGDRPRPIRLPLASRVLFGGYIQGGAWLFAAFGSIFVWAFGVPDVVAALLVPPSDLVAVEATIVEQRATNLTINDETVIEHELAFIAGGQERRARAFTTGLGPPIGATRRARASVSTGYIEADGLRPTRMNAWGLLVLAFPGAALVTIALTLARNARGIALMRRGRPARARLLRVEPTATRVNGRPVMRYVFSFTVDGKAREVGADVLEGGRLTDESEEPVLYDPHDASRAVLLGTLSGDPRLQHDGSFTTSGNGLPSLVSPSVFVAVNVAGWVLTAS